MLSRPHYCWNTQLCNLNDQIETRRLEKENLELQKHSEAVELENPFLVAEDERGDEDPEVGSVRFDAAEEAKVQRFE